MHRTVAAIPDHAHDHRALVRRVLATAIIEAVADHGAPIRVGLVELTAYYRAPRIYYTAPELLRRLHQVTSEILQQLYERDGDPALLDASDRPDPAALVYHRRGATVAASLEVVTWPPCLPANGIGGRHEA